MPEGRSGDWIVDRFEERVPNPGVAEARPHWAISPPGTYTRLRHRERTYMTDLADESWTQRPAIEEACRRGGRVLLTGLGLGVVAEAMLAAAGSGVERVTIVEAWADVMALVAPYLAERHGDAIEVIHASAFEWDPPPGARFTVGWHDIWADSGLASEDEEHQLLERYAPFCDWQGTWPACWRAEAAAAG